MGRSKQKPEGKTLDAFAAAHDPTHTVDNPTVVFDRPIPKGAKRFIITAAQNATPVHADWWRVIETMARVMDAQIMVIPLRYKNPTSQWTGSQQNAEHWANEVRPYLWNTRHALNENVGVLGDIKIQPTASSPLTGAEALSLASSGVIGHTKVQLRSIATPSSRMAKMLTTTGACTVENYTDTRAGRIGEFHHSLCAVLVELDGPKRFFIRHLHYDANTKSCTDLDNTYTTTTGAHRAACPLALIMGDTHVDSIDPSVKDATFGKSGLICMLEPKYIVFHDLLDAYSCNPHHFGNPFNAVAKQRGKTDDVQAEVNRAISFIHQHTPEGVTSVVVPSNHDDMLARWVIKADWKLDPVNAQFYLETALAMVRNTAMGPGGTVYPDPFSYWLRKADPRRMDIKILSRDESFMLAGVELGMHGDRGPNGARGSVKNLRRIGTKSVIGHSHSPGIDEGCYQVGTSTRLRLEYTSGPSSWLNCHCILHANGKRQLIVLVDGKFRA